MEILTENLKKKVRQAELETAAGEVLLIMGLAIPSSGLIPLILGLGLAVDGVVRFGKFYNQLKRSESTPTALTEIRDY